MPKNIWILGVSALFFFIFVFFSFLVHKDIFTQLDFNTTVILQDNLPRRFDSLFSLFSDIGSFEPVLIFLIILLLVRRKILGAISAIFMFGVFHLLELYGKFFVDHLPPPQFLLRTQHQVEFPQFHVRAEFSYPSGHSGRAVFIATLLLFWIWGSKLPIQIKIIGTVFIVGYVGIMLVSRVYLGEHWSTDVIGGAILGLSCGLFSSYIFHTRFFPKKKKVAVQT